MKLLNGDCLKLMKDLPDGTVDLILCDPPYGTTDCEWDSILPFDILWAEYDRVLKPNGVAVQKVGGRHFIGIEQNQVYFEIAEKRIKESINA